MMGLYVAALIAFLSKQGPVTRRQVAVVAVLTFAAADTLSLDLLDLVLAGLLASPGPILMVGATLGKRRLPGDSSAVHR